MYHPSYYLKLKNNNNQSYHSHKLNKRATGKASTLFSHLENLTNWGDYSSSCTWLSLTLCHRKSSASELKMPWGSPINERSGEHDKKNLDYEKASGVKYLIVDSRHGEYGCSLYSFLYPSVSFQVFTMKYWGKEKKWITDGFNIVSTKNWPLGLATGRSLEKSMKAVLVMWWWRQWLKQFKRTEGKELEKVSFILIFF